jgi:hypothetical protein
MTRIPAIILILGIFFVNNTSFTQILPSIAIHGGPIAGWHFNNVDDLNKELKLAGFPELSKSGFFTLGGAGYIDLPLDKRSKEFIRFGGLGIGFSSKKDLKINDTLTKAFSYNFGMGGLSIEYVRCFGIFDLFAGALFSTGTLKLDLYQYGSNYGKYSGIMGEFQNISSSGYITRNFSMRFFGFHPQFGVGFLIKKVFYLKLSGGYLLSTKGTWKVDNDVEVKDFPSGVKPGGFTINLGLNFGLFIRD